MDKKYDTSDDFLSDSDFFRLLKRIRLEEVPVSQEKIQKDYDRLEANIHRRKNKRIIYWVSSVAASLLLMLVGTYFFYANPDDSCPGKNELLSRLEHLETSPDNNNIQLIFGENKKESIDKDAVIMEKSDGSILINDDRMIRNDEKTAEYIQLVVPNGKRSCVELRDGTKIWVNSGSKLLYPSRFDRKKREIYIEGEAYLEVARNDSLPFFVHTTDLDVKVLGTSFNVSAYRDDRFTEVILVSGSVEACANEKEAVTLTPNTCYHLEGQAGEIRQVNAYNYICWKDGIMKTEGVELQSIFKRLSRYYNVSIETFVPHIENVRYYGKLALEDDIEHILYNISLVEPIRYTREGNAIQIYSSN
ncbi:MAG: FecR family protein [Tannerella sp.]|jgi:hypothetical protein|nr:FecR family protein [Tannerella sp.]